MPSKMSVSNKKKDVLLVGTSPLVVLEALYQKRLGHKVELIDKSEYFGGAWLNKPIFGYQGIEVGCHYMSRSPIAYQFLQNYLSIKFEIGNRTFLDMTSRNLFEKKELSYFEKILIPHQYFKLHGTKKRQLFKFLKHSFNFDFSNTRKAWNSLIDFKSLYYPSKGSPILLNKLQDKLAEASIDIHRQKIKQVNIQNNQVYCTLNNGQIWQTKTLILGQNTDLDIMVEGEKLPINRVHRHFVHVVLLVKGRKLKDFFTIQKKSNSLYVMEHKDFILRISDVGKFCREFQEKDKLLLCLQLTPEAFEVIQDYQDCMRWLHKLGLINKEAKVLNYHVENYQSSWIGKKDYTQIKNLFPKSIKILETKDLSFGIEKYYDQWKELLYNKPF